ncbi:MAG: GntR family transcriptional regulator [Desulfobacterales bacterium]|nr:GntR family transcriptional regulator [Desulfobacterales bacterium]
MPKKKNHIKSLPLSEIAYHKIKELIVTLKLGPRDQVDEEWVAEELSIGRTPIREALFRLNAENLVEVVHGRGFFVQDITLSNLRDLFETMLILERSAVALAANRIQTDQIEDLQRINSDLRQAWLEQNFLHVTLLNSRFHRIIYKAMDNSFLFSYLDNLQNQSQRLAYMCFSKDLSSYDMQSHAKLSIKDHQSIIELFKQGNDIEAVKVISEHVKLFQRRVNHFMLPSLDILDAVSPLQGGQNLTCSKEA